MNRLALPLALLLASATFGVAGCGFYYGSDDDDQCRDRATPEIAPLELRNPETGQCQSFGGGGWCDDRCGACPAAEGEIAVEPPTWGYCYDQCAYLDESTCLNTAACRAGYMDVCPPNAFCELEASIEFAACWAVDQTGPVQGACAGLDALDCSRHDDCRAIHGGDGNSVYCTDAGCLGSFLSCTDEVDRRDPGTCWDQVSCDEENPDCPRGTTPGIRNGCYSGQCIDLEDCEDRVCDGLSERLCVDADNCDALYEGVDCVCDANGCSCSEWLYDSCADA